MTRYRGGTYSHTVDRIVFADGSSARTDLIRLNPNVDAYSLDFTGVAPTHPSHYRAATWTEVPSLQIRTCEAEVDWILRNSFPTIGVRELSRRLRAAGYALGVGNIAEHEAIAATQAAIWRFTNDLPLDNRPLDVPINQRRDSDGLTVEFDGEFQLGGFTVDVTSAGDATVTLQKSADGKTWRDVPGSALAVEPGARRYRKTLGVGSTLSRSRRGRNSLGYRFYRLRAEATVQLGEAHFWLHGTSQYRNADRVVLLYNYLLAGAGLARRQTVAPELSASNAILDGGVVGPIRLHTTDAAALTVSNGTLLDSDGRELTGPLEPGTEMYVRVQDSLDAVVLTITVPATPSGFGGRVITGVARDDLSKRHTPVALAVPAQLVIEFALSWAIRRASTAESMPRRTLAAVSV